MLNMVLLLKIKPIIVFIVSLLLALILFQLFKHKQAADKPVEIGEGIIMEFSPEGDLLWQSKDFIYPVCFSKDSEGNSYIADRNSMSFFALDQNDKIFFTYSLSSIVLKYIQKTIDNTYLLVFLWDGISVIEVDSIGRTLFKVENLKLNPEKETYEFNLVSEARKIKNGNYLLAIDNQSIVIEVDKNNNIVRKTPENLCHRPTSLQVLENNRYLLSCFESVIEIDNNFNFITEYSFDKSKNPYYVRKTANNSYVVADINANTLCFYNENLKLIKKINSIDVTQINYLSGGNIFVSAIMLEPIKETY